MKQQTRPIQAKVFAALLLACGVLMALMGMSASAYYVPAACLLLQAILMWRGRGFRLFKLILELNQLTGILLILVLWLGDALHLPKLNISAAMLLGNLLFGGPLLSILAIGLLGSFHFSHILPGWLGATPRTMPGKAYPLPQSETKSSQPLAQQ